eukprot:440894-Prymnesium_polylepis.1
MLMRGRGARACLACCVAVSPSGKKEKGKKRGGGIRLEHACIAHDTALEPRLEAAMLMRGRSAWAVWA